MKKTVWIINHYAIPPSLGGLNRHYYFKKYLEQDDFNVRIFSSARIHNSDANMTIDGKLFTERNVDGEDYVFIRSPKYSGNGFKRIWNMLSFVFSIKKIWGKYKEDNPDLIYTSSPDPFTALAAQRLAKRHNLPNIVEIRDLWPLSIVEYKGVSEKNPLIWVLYKLEKYLYKKADALVFTIPGCKDYIKDKKWVKEVNLHKIYYINNGVDLEGSTQEHPKLDDNDLESTKFKVTYCGSVRSANNVALLVETARLLRNDPDIEFLVFGDGDQKQALEDICQKENLTNIKFKGHVDKKYIPYILSKSSLNVLTYKNAATWKYGGSQNKMFDYLASGVPVVTNIKMGYSLLEEYKCGIECDSSDAADFASAVISIKSLDKTEYNRMCENAKSVAKTFDYQMLTRKLESVISNTIDDYTKKRNADRTTL